MSDWNNEILRVDWRIEDAIEYIKAIERIYDDEIQSLPDDLMLPERLQIPRVTLARIMKDLQLLQIYIKPEVESAVESLSYWSDMADGASY